MSLVFMKENDSLMLNSPQKEVKKLWISAEEVIYQGRWRKLILKSG